MSTADQLAAAAEAQEKAKEAHDAWREGTTSYDDRIAQKRLCDRAEVADSLFLAAARSLPLAKLSALVEATKDFLLYAELQNTEAYAAAKKQLQDALADLEA